MKTPKQLFCGVTAASKLGLTATLQVPQHSKTNVDQQKQSFRSYWFVTKVYGLNRSVKYSETLQRQFQHPALLTKDLPLQLLQGKVGFEADCSNFPFN